MTRSLTITLPLILVFWLVGCGSAKTNSTAVTNQKQVNEKAIVIKEKTNIVTEHFGDTLRGLMPLPKLGKLPIRYQVSSGGTTLNLEVTDSTLRYESIPKQNGKTTTNIDKTTTKNSSDKTDTVVTDHTTTVKHGWRPPFWMYLVALALIVVLVYCLKNPLKTH